MSQTNSIVDDSEKLFTLTDPHALNIQEKLSVTEKIFKNSEQEKKRYSVFLQQRRKKETKRFVISFICINIVFLAVSYVIHLNFLQNMFFQSSNILMYVSIILLLFVASIMIIGVRNTTAENMFDRVYIHMAHKGDVMSLCTSMLEHEYNAHVINISNMYDVSEWQKMSISMSNFTRDYYVCFPKDDKGYRSIQITLIDDKNTLSSPTTMYV